MWIRANGKKIEMDHVVALPWYSADLGDGRTGYVLTAKEDGEDENQYLIGTYSDGRDLLKDKELIQQAMQLNVFGLVIGTRPVPGMEVRTDDQGRIKSIWCSEEKQYFF